MIELSLERGSDVARNIYYMFNYTESYANYLFEN